MPTIKSKIPDSFNPIRNYSAEKTANPDPSPTGNQSKYVAFVDGHIILKKRRWGCYFEEVYL